LKNFKNNFVTTPTPPPHAVLSLIVYGVFFKKIWEGIFESYVDVEFFSKVDIDEFLNYFNRLEKSYLGLLEKKWRGGGFCLFRKVFFIVG
jgi:hypothetical protein